MNVNLIIPLLILIVSNSCKLPGGFDTTKPVLIDGLGSLSSLTDKQLSEKELSAIVTTVTQRNFVTDEDARPMLGIYKSYIKGFADNLSNSGTENHFSKNEIEKYIALMVEHQSLKDDVERATRNEVLVILVDGIDFEEGAGGNVIKAGAFTGIFLNAYFNKIAKDDENLRNEKYNESQGNSQTLVLRAYEQAATEITGGQRQTTSEQKVRAGQFLEDLRTYNEELDDGEKILGTDGRLIDSEKAAGNRNFNQNSNMESIVFGTGNSRMKNRQRGEEAAKRMGTQMERTYLNFRQSITDNLKRR